MTEELPLLDRICNCLESGDSSEALQSEWAALLTETGGSDKPFRLAVRKSITGNGCLLLRSATAAMRLGGRTRLHTLTTALRKFVDSDFSDEPQLQRQLMTRVLLFEALAADQDQVAEDVLNSLRIAVQACIETYSVFWQWTQTPYTQALEAHSTGPACLQSLPDEYKYLLRELAKKHGWTHPGLVMAAETMALLVGQPARSNATVQTWVLFAGEDSDYNLGVLVRLTMERLPEGTGLLSPSAASSGYLLMGQGFSQGLQNAWFAVRTIYAGGPNFDWRWSLDLYNGTRLLPGAPMQVPIDGRSPEAALVCAMLALHPSHKGSFDGQDPLDPHVAITAQLAKPGESGTTLSKVTSVGVKTLAKDLEKRRVRDIVVAEDHDDDDLPHDERFTMPFPRARDLNEAWELLSRWPRITRTVKSGIQRQASTLLDSLCGPETNNPDEDGHRYVQSPLRQVFPHLRSTSQSVESLRENEPHHDLTDRELGAFTNGTWQPRSSPDEPPTARHSAGTSANAVDKSDPISPNTAPRIWLHADSGMGKSVQMVACERTIAANPDMRIPIRVGKALRHEVGLSQFVWMGNQSSVLQQLLECLLLDHIATEDQQYAVKWLERVVRQGNAVFLLDALDQTDDNLNGLGAFLNKQLEIRNCLAIVAGRDEAFTDKESVFHGLAPIQWTRLKVREFGPEEQRAFLGSQVAPQLIPDVTSSVFKYREEEVRKLMWQDLLGVPLLLKMMKDLASTSNGTDSMLDGICNRFSLYEMAVQRLIDKGKSTLQGKSGAEREETVRQLDEVLGEIAWFAISRQDFSSILSGRDYERVMARHRAVLPNLFQIDLLSNLLDRYGQQGLEWRHRSFCEYFAARYLMSSKADTEDLQSDERIPFVTADDRAKQLRAIHDIESASGTNQDRPASWYWTLRFALCYAEQGLARDNLALELIKQGNPWIVYEAIDRDGLVLNKCLGQLVRWLVHRDCSEKRDYSDAHGDGTLGRFYRHARDFSEVHTRPARSVVEWWRGGGLSLAEAMLASGVRDGRYVDPLLDLMAVASDVPRWKSESEDWVPRIETPRLELPGFFFA